MQDLLKAMAAFCEPTRARLVRQALQQDFAYAAPTAVARYSRDLNGGWTDYDLGIRGLLWVDCHSGWI